MQSTDQAGDKKQLFRACFVFALCLCSERHVLPPEKEKQITLIHFCVMAALAVSRSFRTQTG